jgi:predicted metal-dependent hydrolase
MHELFRQDGIDGTKMRFKGLWFLFGYPGILRQMLPMWLSFFSPRFHPWQHDDRDLIEEHLPHLGMPNTAGDGLIKL